MLKQKLILIIIGYFLCIFSCNAQLQVNIGVDTTSQLNQDILVFYNEYITDYKNNSAIDFKKYFKEEEIEGLQIPDKTGVGLIGSRCNYIMGTPLVLNISHDSTRSYLKVMFVDSEEGQYNVNFIANYILSKVDKRFYFEVYEKAYSDNWNSTKIRNVTYLYPLSHDFDKDKAEQLKLKIISLEKDWGFEPIDITYYMTDNRSDMEAVKGFDYNFYMGASDLPSGIQYQSEKTIFGSGMGEDFFHEFVHTYINNKYPNNVLKEGIATFYGGARRYSYQQGLLEVFNYIKVKKEVDISNSREFYYLNESINPQYFLESLVCHIIYTKDGVNGLKRLMSYTSIDSLYLEEFGIEKKDRNVFLRRELELFINTLPEN